jgi:hypothetical protein
MRQLAELQKEVQHQRLQLERKAQRRRLEQAAAPLGAAMLDLIARGLAVKPSRRSSFFAFRQDGADDGWAPCMLDFREESAHQAVVAAWSRQGATKWHGVPRKFRSLQGGCITCHNKPAEELGGLEESLLQWLSSRGYSASCQSVGVDTVEIGGGCPSPSMVLRVMRVAW